MNAPAPHCPHTPTPITRSMDLSILIVTYNSGRYIGPLLDGIAADRQAAEGMQRWEIIVADNASVDDTVDQVQAHPAAVQLLRNPGNLGFAAAVNQAARQATGRALLLLNPDALPQPGHILQGTRLFLASELFAAGGLLLDSQGQAQPSARFFPRLRDELYVLAGLSAKHPQHPQYARLNGGHLDADGTHTPDWIPGAFLWLDRQKYEQLHGLDERYFMYYEELDLFRRAHLLGLQTRYWGHLRASHVGGASARTVSGQRVSRAGSQLEAWQMRSALLYYRRWHGLPGVLAYTALHGLWATLVMGKSMLRRDQPKRDTQASRLAQLWRAMRDTRLGAISPSRPW